MAEKKQTRVVLWCTPRSLSTAMFRAMWNKSSCKCLPEPYGMAHFFSGERVVNWFTQMPVVESFDYLSIKRELYEAPYEEDEVFIKDFPSYIYRQKKHNPLDLIPKGYVHAFLLRKPRPTLESSYRLFQKHEVPGWTEFENDMVGYKYLWDFYNVIKEIQPDPLVILAEDLMANPEPTLRLFCERTGLKFEDSMIKWKANDGLQEKLFAMFPMFQMFTETVLTTDSFKPYTSNPKPIDLPPEIEKGLEEHNIYYEKLRQFATPTASLQ